MASISNLAAKSYQNGKTYTNWGEPAYVGNETGYGNMVMVWRFTIDSPCSEVVLTGAAYGQWAYAAELSYYLSSAEDDSNYINYIGSSGRLGSVSWTTVGGSQTITLRNIPAGTWYVYFCPAYENCLRSRVSTPTGSCTGAAEYGLTKVIGAGTNLTLTLSYSPFRSAGINIGSGDVIYAGETLKVTFSAQTGYMDPECTVSGVGSVSSGDTFSVSGNCTVISSATKIPYTLSYQVGNGAALVVTRNGSALASGATIYYGDTLSISFAAQTGYEIKSATLNGNKIQSPTTHKVAGNVSIVIVSAPQGFAEINEGGEFSNYLTYIFSGGTRDRYLPKIRENGAWVDY